MMRSTSLYFATKVSPVAIRPVVSQAQLAATPNYKPLYKHRLSRVFDRVNNQNRFESLKIILSKLSGHVGRRQYPMQHQMDDLFLDKFKQVGLDWHEILHLASASSSSSSSSSSGTSLARILESQIGMTPSQRRLFMTAVHCRLCGVLTEGSSTKPGNICMNRGQPEHGFRCGKKDHTSQVYFEGKPAHHQQPGAGFLLDSSSSSAAGKSLRDDLDHHQQQSTAKYKNSDDTMASSSEKDEIPDIESEFPADDQNVRVRVSTKPDFRVVGRLHQQNAAQLHPRAWTAPTLSSFDIQTIGYEFYVHPSDARVRPQIVEAAGEWQLHAEVLRNVIWELLEVHAVEKQGVQPFALARGDVRSERDVLDVLRSYYSTVDPETGVIIENCMTTTTTTSPSSSTSIDDERRKSSHDSGVTSHHFGGGSTFKNVVPWFIPSDPRPVNDRGVPEYFPLAPSIAVQCLYRRPTSDVLHGGEDRNNSNSSVVMSQQQSKLVAPPLLEFMCFGHRNACFAWPSPEVKSKAVSEILEFAQKVPFALPFTLYFRVDSTEELQREQGQLRKEIEKRIEDKAKFFDLSKYSDIFAELDRMSEPAGKTTTATMMEEEDEQKSSATTTDSDHQNKEDVDEMEMLVRSLNPEGWD